MLVKDWMIKNVSIDQEKLKTKATPEYMVDHLNEDGVFFTKNDN